MQHRTFNAQRLRLMTLFVVGWIQITTVIPGFLMRVFNVTAPGISGIAWGINIVMTIALVGYLCFGFLRDRRITLFVVCGIFLLLLSQLFRMAVLSDWLALPASPERENIVRAVDNLVNGFGLAAIGLAFFYLIIELLAQRQDLLDQHEHLSEEVSRRREAEGHLREREALLSGIGASALDGIIVMDENAHITYWNPAAVRIMGYAANEVVGAPPQQEFVTEEHKANLAAGVEMWLRDRGKVEEAPFGAISEFAVRTKDGEAVDVELSVSSMDLDGKPHAVGILRDISERKRMEQERRDFEVRIQRTQKLESLGVLAGGVAHDFNNILQIIATTVNVLEPHIEKDTPSHFCLEKLKKCVGRASALTHQMLAYSGRRSIKLQHVDVVQIVEQVVQLLQTSVPRNVQINSHLVLGLPQVTADAGQIEQVIMNLLMNAAEAMDEEQGGVITVSTMMRHCDSDFLSKSRVLFDAPEGEYVCVEVSDTGRGMDTETLDKMFDPFFTTKFTGYGLGLPAVLGIMRAHKGALLVNSVPGEGTTIRALFPPSAAYAIADTPAVASGERAPVSPLAEKQMVLLVDDDPDALELGAMMLTQLGCDVITAGSGREAVETFQKRHTEIDGVLLDMKMPELNGIQTYHKLCETDPEVPVMLVSGYADQDIEPRLREQGIRAFLAKPYDAHTLAETMERAFSAQSVAAQSATGDWNS